MDNTEKEKKLLTLFKRILTRCINAKNTSEIDRTISIKRLALRCIELIEPENKLLDEHG